DLSDDVLTLSTLRDDVIRRIIAIDRSDSAESMRWIFRRWNVLVAEYIHSHPSIESISINCSSIYITVKHHNLHLFSLKQAEDMLHPPYPLPEHSFRELMMVQTERGRSRNTPPARTLLSVMTPYVPPPRSSRIVQLELFEEEFIEDDDEFVRLRKEKSKKWKDSLDRLSHYIRLAIRVKKIQLSNVDTQKIIEICNALSKIKICNMDIRKCYDSDLRSFTQSLCEIFKRNFQFQMSLESLLRRSFTSFSSRRLENCLRPSLDWHMYVLGSISQSEFAIWNN
ncbi:hypothetical protein PMAYCL1PPCAC_03356, partial [Pristionchus mayeri]